MITFKNKALIIAGVNFKRKVANWQNLFYAIGFPVMFTFGTNSIEGTSFNTYDYSFPGMVIYATGGLVIGSSIYYASEKKTGMLARLDTMPIGRKNIFLGFLFADSLFGVIQIGVMFILGYLMLQIYVSSVGALFIGFLIAIVFGIQSIGVGIILASFAKSGEAANGFSMMYYMPVIFASGALIPFESPIVFFLPPYWAKQIYLQLTVMNHSLTDILYSSSLIGTSATPIGIPIWGGLLILIGMTVGFMLLGIYLFQKKTKF